MNEPSSSGARVAILRPAISTISELQVDHREHDHHPKPHPQYNTRARERHRRQALSVALIIMDQRTGHRSRIHQSNTPLTPCALVIDMPRTLVHGWTVQINYRRAQRPPRPHTNAVSRKKLSPNALKVSSLALFPPLFVFAENSRRKTAATQCRCRCFSAYFLLVEITRLSLILSEYTCSSCFIIMD